MQLFWSVQSNPVQWIKTPKGLKDAKVSPLHTWLLQVIEDSRWEQPENNADNKFWFELETLYYKFCLSLSI